MQKSWQVCPRWKSWTKSALSHTAPYSASAQGNWRGKFQRISNSPCFAKILNWSLSGCIWWEKEQPLGSLQRTWREAQVAESLLWNTGDFSTLSKVKSPDSTAGKSPLTQTTVCSVSREAALMVIQQETLQLKAELELTSHFHISITPNTAGKTAAAALFQKGSPAYAAPYSYG